LIVILDYGINNIRSVEKAVQFLGYDCRVQSDLAGASKVILPGVGAFGKAMERLAPIRSDLRSLAADGVPLLGICLGQQLLFESSEEFGSHEGLGIVPGWVRYLPKIEGLKIPHMGWSTIDFKPGQPLGAGISESDRVFFVHSLYTECADPADIAATTEYGTKFPSAIARKNVWGTQFHPEKSGQVGLHILRNFLEC